MKLLTFADGQSTRAGCVLDDGRVLDITAAWKACEHPLRSQDAPRGVLDIIALGDQADVILPVLLAAAGSADVPVLDADKLSILPPVHRPAKNIFCVGRNYRAHIIEGNIARGRDPESFPKAAEFFTKPPTAVVGHKADVSRHARHTNMLDYEVELGIVIGKAGKDITPEAAMDHVFGYTIVNDITARDLQALHGQWFKGKALDGTCPIGPVVAMKSAVPDPGALTLELSVNDELRQSAHTSDLLFDVSSIIAQLSAGMTLEPGDIIATGTPSGVGFAMDPPRSLEPGDIISARIESIGELINTIV